MTVTVELAIEGHGWSIIPDLDGLVGRAVDAAARVSAARLAEGAELSVLLSHDAAVQGLNREWRGIDEPTNVLSFPVAMPRALEQRPLLGDVVIAWETTEREAADEDKPIAAHLTHLVVHGFLHVVGYDHETEAEAEGMEELEVRILASLGIADPYHGTDVTEKHAR